MWLYVLGQWGVDRQIEMEWLNSGLTEKHSCPTTKRISCLNDGRHEMEFDRQIHMKNFLIANKPILPCVKIIYCRILGSTTYDMI